MIPQVVHHIWADVPGREEPTPAWVIRQMGHWDERWLPAGWEHQVWTTEAVLADPTLSPIAETARTCELPHRGLSDLLRWRILGLYGGVYMDIDVLPLGDLDALIEQPTLCTSGPSTKRTLDQWGMALPIGYPLAADVLAYAAHALRRGVRNEHAVAGPQATRRIWDEGEYEARVYWNCTYAGTKATRTAMRTGDLSGLAEVYPGVPLLPTYGGHE